MAELMRVKINWTDFIGGPGYTNLYFEGDVPGSVTQADAQSAATQVDTWLNAWVPMLPSDVVTRVDPTVDVINDATGQLNGFLSVTTEAAAPGGDVQVYAAGVGACVNWYTPGIRNGRRIRGRTFMAPLAGNSFATDGTLDTNDLAAWRTATDVLVDPPSASRLMVWSRPSAPGLADGVSYYVASFTINDKAAYLSSRRS